MVLIISKKNKTLSKANRFEDFILYIDCFLKILVFLAGRTFPLSTLNMQVLGRKVWGDT